MCFERGEAIIRVGGDASMNLQWEGRGQRLY